MGNASHGNENEPAFGIVDKLSEETMRLAWGEDRSREYRRRVVLAAIVFGEKFERRITESPPASGESETQRFLMPLMNDVIREFAAREKLEEAEAADFLGKVETRDYILEFNEVLDAANGSGRTLDDLLREAVESRRERAVWSRHWSSG